MTILRDALATALAHAYDRQYPTAAQDADDILADPGFRAALVGSIAEALSTPDDPPGWAWLETEDKRLDARAEAIVARMLRDAS